MCGVYAITNLSDGRATTYVGSTILSFRDRWGHHVSALRRRVHSNRRLQRAWNRDGEHSFAFTVLEVVDNLDDVLTREQYWLNTHRETGSVYNFSIVAGSPMRGLKHTEKTKRRLSETSFGRKHTEDAKQKIAKSHEKPYPSFLNVNTGEVIPSGMGLTRMCKERGLGRSDMNAVKNGKQRSSQGWILESNARLAEAVRNIGRYPAFVNVHTGNRIDSGKGLAGMCHEHGLCQQDMRAVKNGQQKSHRGWILADHPEHADGVKSWRRHPAFINKDTGKVIPAGYNLARVCREHGLKRSGMYMVANGNNQSNYGWELLNETGG